MTKRRSFGVVAVAAMGSVALATGIAQGDSGPGGTTHLATVDDDVTDADLRPCPGAAPVGRLDAGDPVTLTGRSEDGAWLRLESPVEDYDSVWIDATQVVVTTPEDLPIARCGDVDLAIELIGGVELVLTPKTTTTTTPDDEDDDEGDDDGEVAAGDTTTTRAGGDRATTTEQPSSQPTGPAPTGPGPTQPPSTSPPTTRPRTTTTRPRPTTTTTTLPPDVTPPTVDSFTKNRARIRETGNCDGPVNVLFTARVQDESGIARVRLVWRIDDAVTGTTLVNGTITMTDAGGGIYRVNLGPFDQSTVGPNNGVLVWRVRATDASPNANEIIVDPGADLRLPVKNCP